MTLIVELVSATSAAIFDEAGPEATAAAFVNVVEAGSTGTATNILIELVTINAVESIQVLLSLDVSISVSITGSITSTTALELVAGAADVTEVGLIVAQLAIDAQVAVVLAQTEVDQVTILNAQERQTTADLFAGIFTETGSADQTLLLAIQMDMTISAFALSLTTSETATAVFAIMDLEDGVEIAKACETQDQLDLLLANMPQLMVDEILGRVVLVDVRLVAELVEQLLLLPTVDEQVALLMEQITGVVAGVFEAIDTGITAAITVSMVASGDVDTMTMVTDAMAAMDASVGISLALAVDEATVEFIVAEATEETLLALTAAASSVTQIVQFAANLETEVLAAALSGLEVVAGAAVLEALPIADAVAVVEEMVDTQLFADAAEFVAAMSPEAAGFIVASANATLMAEVVAEFDTDVAMEIAETFTSPALLEAMVDILPDEVAAAVESEVTIEVDPEAPVVDDLLTSVQEAETTAAGASILITDSGGDTAVIATVLSSLDLQMSVELVFEMTAAGETELVAQSIVDIADPTIAWAVLTSSVSETVQLLIGSTALTTDGLGVIVSSGTVTQASLFLLILTLEQQMELLAVLQVEMAAAAIGSLEPAQGAVMIEGMVNGGQNDLAIIVIESMATGMSAGIFNYFILNEQTSVATSLLSQVDASISISVLIEMGTANSGLVLDEMITADDFCTLVTSSGSDTQLLQFIESMDSGYQAQAFMCFDVMTAVGCFNSLSVTVSAIIVDEMITLGSVETVKTTFLELDSSMVFQITSAIVQASADILFPLFDEWEIVSLAGEATSETQLDAFTALLSADQQIAVTDANIEFPVDPEAPDVTAIVDAILTTEDAVVKAEEIVAASVEEAVETLVTLSVTDATLVIEALLDNEAVGTLVEVMSTMPAELAGPLLLAAPEGTIATLTEQMDISVVVDIILGASTSSQIATIMGQLTVELQFEAVTTMEASSATSILESLETAQSSDILQLVIEEGSLDVAASVLTVGKQYNVINNLATVTGQIMPKYSTNNYLLTLGNL